MQRARMLVYVHETLVEWGIFHLKTTAYVDGDTSLPVSLHPADFVAADDDFKA